jgi:hypothetical protein
MEFKVRNIGFVALGLGAVYLAYRLINNGYSYAAKYPRLYTLVTRGESKTYNDYNFYTISGLKSNVDGKGSKYPLLNRALSSYTVGAIKKMQAENRYDTNGQLYATGRYQIIPGTLIAMTKLAKISDSAIYDNITQDKLANALIASKSALNNYLTGKVPDTDTNLRAAALGVAQIWSSVGQPSNNKSYYGENATVSTTEVQKMLRSYR